MRLLLISNSTRHGERYLDHCAEAIRSLLGTSLQRVLFVPYAIHDYGAYAATVRSRFEVMGYGVDAVHDAEGGPLVAVEQAQAIFIGGGNTFRLIDALWRHDLIEPIRRRVTAGMPYIGYECRRQRRVSLDPHHQRHADCATAVVQRTRASCRSRSIRTIRIRFPARRIWARRVSSASPNSTRKTSRRSSACEKVRGCTSRATR